MSKRSKKGTVNNIEREVRAARKAMGFAEMNSMLGDNLHHLNQQEKFALMKAIEKKYHNGVDLSYLKAVLFPEMYSVDIPQPMSNLSYARFTDKQDGVVSTGGGSALGGCGMLVWYPRTTSGPSLFYYYCATSDDLPTINPPVTFSVDTIDANTAATPKILAGSSLNYTYLKAATTTTTAGITTWTSGWRAGFAKNYETYYTQTALVAASISVQFVGQVDKESGFMVGSHVYGQGINNLLIDDIENGQCLAKGRPSEGLRFVYLPMEGTDYEFYPASSENSHNCGAQPTGNEQQFRIWTNSTNPVAKLNSVVQAVTPLLDISTSTAKNTSTVTNDILYSNNTHYIAIYWKGLPAGESWLRVDTTRKFNGIPKQQFRDIVEVSRSQKNFDQKKTFDVLRKLTTNAPVGGHTLKELDRTQDRIQQALPNLANGGMVDRIDGLQTLADFAGTLETPDAMSTGLVGPVSGMNGRLYPFDT